MTPTVTSADRPLEAGEVRRYFARVHDLEGNHPKYGDDWFRVRTVDNLTGLFATRQWAQDALDQAIKSYRYGELAGHTDTVIVEAPGPTLSTIRINDWLVGNVVPIADVPLPYRANYRDTLRRAALAAYRYGHVVYVSSSFRTRKQQEAAYDLYINHGGPLAAVPGTSPHERGLGLDIPNARTTPGLIVELRKLGLKDDVPSEIWHVTNHAKLRSRIDVTERTFDWIPRFDERSRMYAVAPHVEDAELVTKIWDTAVTLDQGTEGACTGFATAHELNAEPCVVPVDNGMAQALYQRARQLDEWPGEDYDGSSVLAAVKAATEQGFYEQGYRWAFDENNLALAVSTIGPAILGVPWMEMMSRPDADGYIHAEGKVVGGHAILCKGIDVERDAYLLHNSWGPSWGLEGDAWISRDDLRALLADHGEACIPIR